MTTLLEHGKSLVASLILSAIMVVSSAVITGQKQGLLLQQNMEATAKLSDAVIDLRIEMASSKEKFVTREELRAEIQRSVHNGS